MSKVKIQGNASGTGIFTVAAPATNTDRTITLPDTSSTLLAPDSTGSIQLDYAGSNNYLKFISSANYVGRNSSTGDIWLNAQGGQAVNLGINGTAQLKVDGNGRVMMPSQPAFNVTNPGSNPVSGVLTFSTVYLNTGSCYNSSNGRFTAPVAGRYYFYAQFLMNSGASDVRFNVNGSVQAFYGESNETTYKQLSLAGVLNLNVNDYVQVDIWAGSTYGGNYANFTGYLIG